MRHAGPSGRREGASPVRQAHVAKHGIPHHAEKLQAAQRALADAKARSNRHGPERHKPGHLHDDVRKAMHARATHLREAQHRYDQSRFHDRLKAGRYHGLTHTSLGHKLDLHRQYNLHHKGDVARQLHLSHAIHDRGGWRHHRHYGPITGNFVGVHFGHRYPGPSLYPHYCWFPRWTNWVDWCWWDYCHPYYDPRPRYCRPIIYVSAPRLVVYRYPAWDALPGDAAGTWVDVPAAKVPADDLDLQLLAVRFVDPGHPEKHLGPRYRVWFRNTSRHDIATAFNVTLVAANGAELSEDLPQSGVRVESVKAGEIQAVDVRLPFGAYEMGRDDAGKKLPFAQLHAIVDSHGEVAEVFEENNGAMIARGDVLPVDPAAFSTDVETGVAGEMISIAGEGFGPEPGQVLVYVKGLELQAKIEGWYDLGVYVKLPSLPLTAATEMELVVVRGDGAASNALTAPLAPAGTPVAPVPAPH